MTSSFATNAVITSSLQNKHFLETTKEGFPLQKQIPITYEVYQGNGNETVEPLGTNSYSIGSPLTGPLTIDFRTHAQNYYNRTIYLVIPGFVTQDVTVNFPLPPFGVLEINTPNIINTINIPATLNHKMFWIGFGEQGGSILQF